MAIIIASHMPQNIANAPPVVCPGIRIHTMDMLQPPGMGMAPDMVRVCVIVMSAKKTNTAAAATRALAPRISAGDAVAALIFGFAAVFKMRKFAVLAAVVEGVR